MLFAGFVLVGLGAGAWLLATRGVRSAAETALAEALGTPVHIDSARLGWPPPRVSLEGVSVGEKANRELFVERLVVQAEMGALLRGDVRDLRVELWGPRSEPTAGNVQGRAMRRAANAAVESVRFSSVKVDEWDLGRADGATLAAFELADVEVSRVPDEPLNVTADFRIGGGTGDVEADVARIDGQPFLSLVANVEGVALGETLRGGDWKLGGRADGQVFYRGSWSESAPEHVLGADVSVEGLGADDGRGRLLSFAEAQVSELVVDFVRREVILSGLEAADGDMASEFFAASESEEDDVDAPWIVRIPSAEFAGIRIGSGEDLTIERLGLRDVGTPWQTGSVELEAVAVGSRIRLVAERDDSEAPGTATLSVDAFPLSSLTGGLASLVEIDGGLLDLRLTLAGPPGLQGEGEARLREFSAKVRDADGGGSTAPLLEIADVYVGAEYFTVLPPRLRVRAAQIVEPRAWLRLDDGGFEVMRLLDGDTSYEPPAWFQRGLAALREWAGEAPIPQTRPSAVGARLSDGVIFLVGDALHPPLSVELTSVNALIHGPAGPAGPVDLEVGAQSTSVGEVRFRGQTGPAGTDAAGEIGPIQLRDFDPSLEKWVGFGADAGTLGLSWNARLEPEPAMNLRFLLDAIELTGDGERDPLGGLLERPLPDVAAELQGPDGSGQIDLSVQGRADAPNYGLLQALPDALRSAVAGAAAEASPKNP